MLIMFSATSVFLYNISVDALINMSAYKGVVVEIEDHWIDVKLGNVLGWKYIKIKTKHGKLISRKINESDLFEQKIQIGSVVAKVKGWSEIPKLNSSNEDKINLYY